MNSTRLEFEIKDGSLRSELGLRYVLLSGAVAITSLKRGSAVIGTSQGVTFLSITHTYTSKLSKTGLQEIGHIRITENGLNADLTVVTPLTCWCGKMTTNQMTTPITKTRIGFCPTS